jgi:hypothetical protein
LFRLAWDRLPSERDRRLDLLEVAVNFHREEPLVWLLRTSVDGEPATEMEREAFAALSLERHHADALVLAVANGASPWSWRSRDLAASWLGIASLPCGPAPSRRSLRLAR